jgi:hypothetical protein
MLLPYIPFWYNITGAMNTFGIGQYHKEKEYTSVHGNATVGIYIELDITLTNFIDVDIISGTREEMYGYTVITTMSMIASENVEPIGFIYSVLIHYQDDIAIEHDADSYDPPRDNLKFSTGYQMEKEAVCNSTGFVTYLFQMDSIVSNETVVYFIDYIIPLGNLDYANFSLIFYSFLGLYLLLIVLVPFIFHKIIKPVFGIIIDEEDLEREIRFKEYVNKKLYRL